MKYFSIERAMVKVCHYPLIDRQKEMELFFYFLMLKTCGSQTTILNPWPYLSNLDIDFGYNMIVINGRERQGKTRLLHEIEYYINESVPHNMVTLSWGDTHKPYRLLRTLFSEKIGIPDTYNDPNIRERTEKVQKFLYPFKVPEFLCALNDILGVDFPVTKYYLRLTDDQKLYVKRKMVKYLCIKGYKDVGLLLIDNMEFMDENTWSVFKVLLNIEWMFICATMGNYALTGNEAKKIINRSDVKVLRLEPVQKLSHVGLICQDLNVMGCSLELERYIQVHSRGNPGWIESFLTTLGDSDALQIKIMDKYDAHESGFVIPPYDMISRNIEANSNKLRSSSNLMESLTSFPEKFNNSEIEDWDIIHQTIKDDQNLSKEIPAIIQICDLPKKFNLEDMDTEDILDDVTMIQTYDSLKVQEQLLLKCSSILGDSFSRGMLEYVMQSQSIIKNAEAIQKLFEIRVFSCGRANYTNGAIQVDHYLTDPNEETTIACYCTGFPVNPITVYLPPYANCGYIRFREPMFREMLVNLLTDSQANLYHVRSIWYLESQTKRCLDCGLGYFTNLVGQSNDDGMKKYCMENSPSVIRLRNPQESLSGDLFASRQSLTTKSASGNVTNINYSLADIKITREIPAVEKTTNIGIVTDVHVRTFADNNLNECECRNVLAAMYQQMITHCQEAGVHEKLMYSLLEYASLCIRTQNVTISFTLLDNAMSLLHKKLQYEFLEPNWQVPLTRGQIMLLQGQLHIQRSAYTEAEMCLLGALKCYNLTFPTNKLSIHLKTKSNELKQKIIVDYFPHKYIGSRNEDICMLAEQTSQVMSALYMLYRRKLHFDKAYLASIWGMNEALRSDSNFAVMCHAYANLLNMNLIYSKIDFALKLEDMALSMCYRKHTRLELHELEAVAKLYGAIFCRKCLCNNVMESLKLGSIVIQLNSPQFGGASRWLMLPLLLRALIFTYLIAQAAIMVQKMAYFKKTTHTHFAPMMYYTLCLEFRMYTTYSIEPFSYLKSFRVVKWQDYAKRVLTIIEMRYHVTLWLWYVRRRQWEQASGLFEYVKVVSDWPYNVEPSMYNVFIHLLEGFLLVLVWKLETCDKEGVKQPLYYTKILLERLNKMTHKLQCVRSRYLLLKAFWYIIYQKDKKAFKTLDQASAFAKRCGVLYDIDWIEWTRQLWLQRKSKPTLTTEDHWLNATEHDIFVADWEAHDSNEKPIPFYSFYPPKI